MTLPSAPSTVRSIWAARQSPSRMPRKPPRSPKPPKACRRSTTTSRSNPEVRREARWAARPAAPTEARSTDLGVANETGRRMPPHSLSEIGTRCAPGRMQPALQRRADAMSALRARERALQYGFRFPDDAEHRIVLRLHDGGAIALDDPVVAVAKDDVLRASVLGDPQRSLPHPHDGAAHISERHDLVRRERDDGPGVVGSHGRSP